MKLSTSSTWLCAGLIALVTQSSVHANTVQFATTAQFSGIMASPNTQYNTGSNTNSGQATLSWNGAHSNHSRITFDGYRLPGQGNLDFSDFTSPFALGKLTFQNGGSCGLPDLNSADLSLSFLWGDASVPSVQPLFNLSLTELNTPSTKGNKGSMGDLLSFSSTANTFQFDTAAGKYRLDLLGWSKDGGVSFVDSLFGADHSASHLKLYAVLQALPNLPPPDPQAVPVPAAAWLFGTGLIALIGMVRRR